jgi:hypothetical protein
LREAKKGKKGEKGGATERSILLVILDKSLFPFLFSLGEKQGHERSEKKVNKEILIVFSVAFACCQSLWPNTINKISFGIVLSDITN